MSDKKSKCGGTDLACNREAFQNDSSCYRGNVDTTAFIDFPICEPIDPTTPGDPPIVIDYPVVPFTPPPCACVNIDFEVTRNEVEDRSDVEFEINFKSKGDCCEGNYEADVDIAIPCIPFEIDGGSSSVDIDIEAICGLESPEGTFNLGLEVSSCTISIDPKIHISIPKPKEYAFSGEVDISSAGCDSTAVGGELIFDTDSSGCSNNVLAALHLTLPHIANLTVCDSPTVSMTGKLGGSGTINLNLDDDECGYAVGMCPELELNLPCPLPEKGEQHVTAGIKWGSGNKKKTVTVAHVHESSCKLEFDSSSIELELPCPVQETGTKSITGTVGWGAATGAKKGKEAKATLAKLNADSCTIGIDSPDLDMELPFPIVGTNNITTIIDWGSGPQKVTGNPLSLGDYQAAFSDITLGMNLPCPITGDDPEIKATLAWGNKQGPFKAKIASLDTKNCSVAFQAPTLDMEMPCPLDDLNLVGDTPRKGAYVSVTKEDNAAMGCGATWHINLVPPDEDGDSSSSSESSGASSPSSSSSRSSGASSPSSSSSESSGASSPSSSRSRSPGASSPSSSRSPGESSDHTYSSMDFSGSGGEGESSGSNVGKFRAVTDVKCNPSGGLTVTMSTFYVDFDRKTVYEEEDDNAAKAVEKTLARELMTAAIKAVADDPELLELANDPYSENGQAALDRLMSIGNAVEKEDSNDDNMVEDFL